MRTTTRMENSPATDSRTTDRIVTVSSWLIVVWICYIFLGSLPYKFSNHPDTQHIFSTIGQWMSGIIGQPVGSLFSQYGAVLVGSVELITALLLLSPIIYLLVNRTKGAAAVKRFRARIHSIGGAVASMVMAGAVFFHLFTPLGIEVLHNGKSDGGSLFRAAVSILILGIVLLIINRSRGFGQETI